MPGDTPPASEVAHVSLRLGRLMLQSGADTALVQASVAALVRKLGFDAQLLVSTEGLVLTLEDQSSFRTKVGHTVSSMAVNMGALAALDDVVRQAPTTAPDILAIDCRLEAIERGGNFYPEWLVAIGLGLTAGSLARLFGGTWPVVAVSALVGVVSLFLRHRFGAWSMNPIAAASLVALASGLVGALAMKAFPATPPTLCLVAAGMILVPGVPLLNGVRETLGSHVGTGISRLTVGAITILAIASGLFVAASLAGDTLPVEGEVALLPVGEDLFFSGLAGIGYALLFNVPPSAAWACMLCAMAGHGLRTALEHLGLSLVAGSLISAFVAGLVARLFSRLFGVPAVIFAFPGIVAMIPGAYAFRAGLGGLGIMQAGAAAPPALVGETISLAITATLVTAAIAIGLSLALAAPFAANTSRRFEAAKDKSR